MIYVCCYQLIYCVRYLDTLNFDNFATSPNEGILLENGTIQWLRKELEKEYIQNSTGCLSCSIFPICNRGCYQKRKEVDADYCFYGTNAQKMEHAKRIVIEKLYWSHLNI